MSFYDHQPNPQPLVSRKVRFWLLPCILTLVCLGLDGCVGFVPLLPAAKPLTERPQGGSSLESGRIDRELLLQYEGVSFFRQRPLPLLELTVATPSTAAVALFEKFSSHGVEALKKSDMETVSGGTVAQDRVTIFTKYGSKLEGIITALATSDVTSELAAVEPTTSVDAETPVDVRAIQALTIEVALFAPRKSRSLIPKLQQMARLTTDRETQEDPAAKTKQPVDRLPITYEEAAAIALVEVCRIDAGESLDVFVPAGQILNKATVRDTVKKVVRERLSLSIAPDLVPTLSDLFEKERGATSQSRAEGLTCCLIHAIGARARQVEAGDEDQRVVYPASIHACRRDLASEVRQLYGRWLAWTASSRAMEVLRSQQTDTVRDVQQAAVLSLVVLESTESTAELTRLSKAEGELQRALVVKALATSGSASLQPFLADKSPRVRETVARHLMPFPSVTTANWLIGYVTDRSPGVQQVALASITDWPDDLAAPVLWTALVEGVLGTRQDALACLEARLGFPPDFPVEASLATRREVANELFQSQGLSSHLALIKPTSIQGMSNETRLADEIADLRHELRNFPSLLDESDELTELRERLHRFTSSAWDEVTQDVARLGSARRDWLIREVLIEIDERLAIAEKLAAGEVAIRQQAATQLARMAKERPLSELVLQRIGQHMTQEQDERVWRIIMELATGHDSPATQRIAQLALQNQWPDVRVLGCQFLAARPSVEGGNWLLPLLTEEDRQVRLRAIEAAGLCGNPIVLDGLPAQNGGFAIPGLRSILLVNDPQLRDAALVSMARLGDDQAIEELTRQTFSDHHLVRLKAIQLMVKSGQNRFVKRLVELAWTEPADPVKQAIINALETLVPESEHPRTSNPSLAVSQTIDDKVRTWVIHFGKSGSSSAE
jgi:HEAT repeat protein